jgi:NADPH:quinone reductase
MKAVGLYRSLPVENPESLLDLEIARPQPDGRDLLVRVKALSVNPVDVKMRSRAQSETEPHILGWDVAGIVESTGPESTRFQVGDAVYYAGDITRPGGNSEFHLVDERIVGHKPRRMEFAAAAALPLTTLAAWEGLFDRLGVSQQPAENQGKSILIIGATGGVGSIATQLAHWAGLLVVGTASRPATIEWAHAHGADYTINHNEAFVPQLQKLGLHAVDFIFSLNNTDRHLSNMLEAIAPQGKICSIVEARQLPDVGLLSQKSATFAWEEMFTRVRYETPDMIEQARILDKVAELVDSGVLQTTVTERLSPINAGNLRLAHARVEKGDMIGKIVLENWA